MTEYQLTISCYREEYSFYINSIDEAPKVISDFVMDKDYGFDIEEIEEDLEIHIIEVKPVDYDETKILIKAAELYEAALIQRDKDRRERELKRDKELYNRLKAKFEK